MPAITELNGSGNPLDASKLIFTQSTELGPVPEPGSAEQWAQNVCCDHMVTCRWTSKGGWEAPELKPFGDLAISPAASCLHYATQCFEGMKAYRGFDGKLRLFRPDRNAQRLVMSSKRVSLPGFDDRELVKLIMALMRVDGPRWLPKDNPGKFLYIRPAMIGSGRQIGLHVPSEATLMIIAISWPDFSSESPPGALPRPPGLRLLASQNGETRAWPGGFGNAKLGANYGPSLVSLGDCRERGYDQVLWVLGADCQVTEAGASNFFAVVKNAETGWTELLTAPLTDKIILAGVTRQSVLELAQSRLSKELKVVEKNFTMHELQKAWEEGRLVEAFVSGTAFFITPVSVIHFGGQDLDIPLSRKDSEATFATLLKGWLKDIMYGVEPHEWGVVINDEAEALTAE
ncbi:aminotransferase [Dactylonectria estremocensis]|uniref:Branched-chain-amino-acid aminotransferase n=1 Tax=Dactylonectria estremocensis TaxID=1079267 RepID=A0A9P9EUG4_9HYPO|nr:aminotransferase [Dactylonectria estremocensis]